MYVTVNVGPSVTSAIVEQLAPRSSLRPATSARSNCRPQAQAVLLHPSLMLLTQLAGSRQVCSGYVKAAQGLVDRPYCRHGLLLEAPGVQ